MTILLSFIISTKNSSYRLPYLLQSIVYAKLSFSFEILIADCCSSDNTLEVVSNYRSHLPLKVVSFADTGIYNAWNKAVLVANGKWALFLGDDDELIYDERFSQILTKLSSIELFSCYDLIAFSSIKVLPDEDKRVEAFYSYKNMWRGMPFCHGSSLIKLDILRNNSYDENYKIISDYAFFTKVKLTPYIDNTLTLTRIGMNGVSNRKIFLIFREVFDFHFKIYKNPCKLLYLPLKILIRGLIRKNV